MNPFSSKQIIGYLKAFICGVVCGIIGQGIMKIFLIFGLATGMAVPLTVFTFAFLGAILMALGIYGKIINFGCAGAMLPMSGLTCAVTGGIMAARAQGMPLGKAIWDGTKGPASVFIPVGLIAGLIIAVLTITR